MIEQWRQPVQLVDRAGQRRPRLAEQVGQRRGSVVERGDGVADRIAVLRDRPVTSFSSRSIAPENSSPSFDRVSSRVLRSSISCSITWLLSANEFVNDDVLENSESQGVALALQDLDQRRR